MHVLIVRPGAIGDALLTFPVLKALRTRYDACKITFVSNPVVLPLARESGLVDETYDYGSLMWSELFASSGIRTHRLQDVMRHIDYVICWLRDPEGIMERNLEAQGIARIVVAPGRPPNENDIHIVTYLAASIGVADIVDNFYSIEMQSCVSQDEFVHEARPFAIHPGSGGAWKCWPVSHFAAIIRRLWQRQVPVLLLAGPADEERVQQLISTIGTPSQSSLLTLLEHVPLLDVAKQLQRCRGYLGNDSGITHLAAMLGVPTIALFGRSNPVLWHPVGPHVQVIHASELAHLSIDTVIEQVETSCRHSPFG